MTAALTRADGKGHVVGRLRPGRPVRPPRCARTPQAHQAYVEKWFNRTKDLVDAYKPDLLYFDDTVPPLGDAGMSVAAHFCNADIARHQGRLEAVLNTKIYDAHPPQEFYKYLVNDFEGGQPTPSSPIRGRPTPASATGIITAARSTGPRTTLSRNWSTWSARTATCS